MRPRFKVREDVTPYPNSDFTLEYSKEGKAHGWVRIPNGTTQFRAYPFSQLEPLNDAATVLAVKASRGNKKSGERQ